MSPLLVVFVLCVYVGLLMVVSWRASMRGDNSTFFVAGRNQSVWTVTLGRITASMSGVTFVSVPGMVLTGSWTYLQMAMGFVLGQLIIAYVLVPMYYRLGVVSVYEYLSQRFGLMARKSGAWLFFVSKLLGAAVRLMLVCVVLQTLVWDSLGVGFAANVTLTMTVVWLYTFRGGVGSVVRGDVVKTVVLLGTVIAVAVLVARQSACDVWTMASESVREMRVFDWDWNSPTHFVKHFVAGVLSVVAMTGLDQDMMQRTLSCRTMVDARRNVVVSGVLQFGVIAMLLTLGAMMAEYLQRADLPIPVVSDELFPVVAVSSGLPAIVGVLFVLGLAASSFSSTASSVTALTTTLLLDILEGESRFGQRLLRVRKMVHCCVTLCLAIIIVVMHNLSDASAIDVVFRLAAYTYGPILGLFAFGGFTRRNPHPTAIWVGSIVAPLLSLVIAIVTPLITDGFRFGHDILLVNAAIMFVGLLIFSRKNK